MDTIEVDQFEQAQSMRAMVDCTLNIGRLGGLEVTEFVTNFVDIFKIIDA